MGSCPWAGAVIRACTLPALTVAVVLCRFRVGGDEGCLRVDGDKGLCRLSSVAGALQTMPRQTRGRKRVVTRILSL